LPNFDPTPAFQAVLAKIDGNLKPFETLFPDDTTWNNIYHPRRVGPNMEGMGLTAGANIGWTTSFWTGQLWLAYEWTGDLKYRRVAEGHLKNFQDRIIRKIDTDHHDLGFLYTLAAVAPWRLTKKPLGREVGLQAAEALLHRYIPSAGIFQAWGRMDDPDQSGRAIIDCMMNMPLLYWASRETGDLKYAQAAESHGTKSLANFIRVDSTTFHTFYFDVTSGAPRYGKTAQGAQDDSCWARGQAWATYGFVLSYRYTRNPVFLQAAERVTDYFLAHLPADRVAYWDLIYTDGSGEERDSSAAAIAACGLLELARWLPDREKAAAYQLEAETITQSLYEHYSTKDNLASNAQILHGVYSKPGGSGVDEANLWGDYFYVEALMRLARPDWEIYW
jgi:unsaturated chondroitin disaccharide hydrolase